MFPIKQFPKIFIFFWLLLFYVNIGFAQTQYSVEGKIVNKNYQGIKDVSITVKCNGEDHNTLSQLSGYYKIIFQNCSIVTITFSDRRYYAESPITNLSGTSNHTITKVLKPNNGYALLTDEEAQNVNLAYLTFKSDPKLYKNEILEYAGAVVDDRFPEKYRSTIREFETVAAEIRYDLALPLSPMKSPDYLAMNHDNPMVGGAAMYKNKDIIDNLVNSADHTTLVAAIKAAGLVDTLSGKGNFTVFAPTNEAFDKVPAGTVDTLVMPENKAMLTKILAYHVIAGSYDLKKIISAIKKGKGKATFKTLSGGILTMIKKGNKLVLLDEKGGESTITIADVKQANGIIHVVDSILMPN